MTYPIHHSPARRMVAALSIALTLAAGSAHAQSSAARQVSRLLDENTLAMAMLGETRSHSDFVDRLYDGASQDVRYTLRAGQHYVFSGVCDRDCRDLDFRLFDDEYNLITQDTAPDDTPIVEVTPVRTGTFHLRVTMASCGVNPCWWGVAVYH